MPRPSSQRPRMQETSDGQRKAALAWNQGLTGKSRPPATSAAVESCPVDGCGSPTGGPRPKARMVQIRGSQDGAAAHWYCPDRCAAIARARAEIRSIPLRRDGDR